MRLSHRLSNDQRNLPGNVKWTEGVKNYQHNKGYTLFELIVFIIVVGIVFAYAMNRFRDFPGAAERANFMAIASQMQSGVNMEMMAGIASGTYRELRELEGTNPMNLLLEPPTNYLGSFGFIQNIELPRRSWFYDSNRQQLVYLVNDDTDVFYLVNSVPVPTNEIRFELVNRYRENEWTGILIQPILPYSWGDSAELINQLANAG